MIYSAIKFRFYLEILNLNAILWFYSPRNVSHPVTRLNVLFDSEHWICIFDQDKSRSHNVRVCPLCCSAQVSTLLCYRVNDVQKFRFSRKFNRTEEGCEENEFATMWIERTVLVTSYPLPGILRWFPVTSADTFQISPLRNAIETMEKENKWVIRLSDKLSA